MEATLGPGTAVVSHVFCSFGCFLPVISRPADFTCCFNFFFLCKSSVRYNDRFTSLVSFIHNLSSFRFSSQQAVEYIQPALETVLHLRGTGYSQWKWMERLAGGRMDHCCRKSLIFSIWPRLHLWAWTSMGQLETDTRLSQYFYIKLQL